MIDLEKEIKAFSDKYRVKENKIAFDHKRGTWFFEDLSFDDQDEKTLINLRVMWLGWLDCAEQKQAEIDELKAKLAKVESGEWMIVPKEPNKQMSKAGCYACYDIFEKYTNTESIYKAMIEAAQGNEDE